MFLSRDFIVIVAPKDKERFLQFKTRYHQSMLRSIPDIQNASNIWAINSHTHYDLWASIREGDRIFFAMLGSDFSYYGTVHKTLRDRTIAATLWGNTPRILLHDCLVLFTSTKETSLPFNDACKNAGITTPVTFDGIYAAKNKILNVTTIPKESPSGIIIKDDHDGPAVQKSEAVTRFIRDTNKVRQLKKKYDDKCQVCGYVIPITNKIRYSEVHHIHPLKDGGDDDFDNMLVLCPTHHVEFDYKIIGIDADLETIVDRYKVPIGKLRMSSEHKLDMKNIKFHMERMSKNEL